MAKATLSTVFERIRPLLSAGRPVIVAIDGPAGSGKTTLAERLVAVASTPAQAALPGGSPVTTVHMDDLYPGWDGLDHAVPVLVSSILEPLRSGRPGQYRRYDWIAGEYAEARHVPPSAVVVVEGVGSGAAATAPFIDLLVWIEAPPPLRHARGIARDGEAFAPHWERWAAQENRMFDRDRTRQRADILLDGSGEIPDR